nr:hypothetical protein [uncultured Chitinophaga sp.]
MNDQTKKILLVVTNVERYADGHTPTGLWLSELTHIYHSAGDEGYDITIASPAGGNTPVDPESLKPFVLDSITKAYWEDGAFRDKLSDKNSSNLKRC